MRTACRIVADRQISAEGTDLGWIEHHGDTASGVRRQIVAAARIARDAELARRRHRVDMKRHRIGICQGGRRCGAGGTRDYLAECQAQRTDGKLARDADAAQSGRTGTATRGIAYRHRCCPGAERAGSKGQRHRAVGPGSQRRTTGIAGDRKLAGVGAAGLNAESCHRWSGERIGYLDAFGSAGRAGNTVNDIAKRDAGGRDRQSCRGRRHRARRDRTEQQHKSQC